MPPREMEQVVAIWPLEQQTALALIGEFLRQILGVLVRRRQTFCTEALFQSGSVQPSQITPRDSDGVVRSIHNAGAAPLTVIISDGPMAGVARFKSVIAPGATVLTWFPFRAGLYAQPGPDNGGALISGWYDA